jgi:hypothetical protein
VTKTYYVVAATRMTAGLARYAALLLSGELVAWDDELAEIRGEPVPALTRLRIEPEFVAVGEEV